MPGQLKHQNSRQNILNKINKRLISRWMFMQTERMTSNIFIAFSKFLHIAKI